MHLIVHKLLNYLIILDIRRLRKAESQGKKYLLNSYIVLTILLDHLTVT